MQKYILKRLALFLPGLVLISMLVYYLSAMSPLNALSNVCTSYTTNSWKEYRNCLKEEWKTHGLNKPILYFSVQALSEPDSLYLIYDKDKKKAIARLLDQFGNWPEIQAYFSAIALLEDQLDSIKSKETGFSFTELHSGCKAELIALRHLGKKHEIDDKLDRLDQFLDSAQVLSTLKPGLSRIKHRFQGIQTKKSIWKNYIPVIRWNGLDNRYHHWFKKAICLDWGLPYGPSKSINQEIKDRFGVTFSFGFINALIVYLLSIPLGLWAARHKTFDKISSSILFALSSVPGFWLAILLLFTFANPRLELLWFFPQEYKGAGYPLMERVSSMILPLIVYAYSSLALLSRITRNSLLEVGQLNYMRTARAKGLSESKVYWKHGLRNALLPNISLLVFVFPAMFSGSIIIEEIFRIPGLGRYIFEAVGSNNTPAILAVFTIMGFLTLVGYLISDLLAFRADPRLRLNKDLNHTQ